MSLSYGDESTIRSYFFSSGNGMGCIWVHHTAWGGRVWGPFCVPHLYHICGTCGTNINVPHFVVQWGLRIEVCEGWQLRCMRCTSWEVIKLSSNYSSILYFHEIFKAKNCTTFCTTFVVLVVHISNVPHFVVHWTGAVSKKKYDAMSSKVPGSF